MASSDKQKTERLVTNNLPSGAREFYEEFGQFGKESAHQMRIMMSLFARRLYQDDGLQWSIKFSELGRMIRRVGYVRSNECDQADSIRK